MGADPQADLVPEIARLKISLDHAAAATETALAARPPLEDDHDPRSPLAQHNELCRQLAVLRERAASAEQRAAGPRELRAELATLLFFAKTLQADANNWRSALEGQIKELQRRRAAARRERDRLAAAREKLVRRRDRLQSTILQTAGRMAQGHGECRKTLPVFTLENGLTVCSVSVSCPRRGIRFAKQWLVTLDGSHDVQVRRE
jgi:chromosome segregation ATPase